VAVITSSTHPFTRALFTDLLGLAHGHYVRTDAVDNTFAVPSSVLGQGLDLSLVDLTSYGIDAGCPDIEARVDSSSVRSGWESKVALAMAELWFPDGSRHVPLDARSTVARLAARWENDHGVTPVVSFALEGYLLARQPSAERPLDLMSVPGHRTFGTGRGSDPAGLGFEILLAALGAGINVDGLNAEANAGQIEIATIQRDAVGAADDVFLLRELARGVAEERDLGITFMARPFADRGGSGLHVNISMRDTDGDGGNEFDAPSEPFGLSTTCRHAIAGLVEHHEALTALCAPTINSYRRLRPAMTAGYWANWGQDNRTATARVPGARGTSTRIEHRLADASSSPHLVVAALLAAMLDGLERGLLLPPPQIGDADTRPITNRHAPHDLAIALDALEADRTIVDALGPELVGCFIALKRAEVQRWRNTVTDWEQREYGRVY